MHAHRSSALALPRVARVPTHDRPTLALAALARLWPNGRVERGCDEVAGIAAIRHCAVRVVTAGMDRMTFMHPVHVGQLVTLCATVNAAWRTSMEVGVRVGSEDVRTRPVAALALRAGPG